MAEQIKSVIKTVNANQVCCCMDGFGQICASSVLDDLSNHFLIIQGGDLDVVDGMTPLDVVVRILNNQLSTLMWIDEKVSSEKPIVIFARAVRLKEIGFLPEKGPFFL